MMDKKEHEINSPTIKDFENIMNGFAEISETHLAMFQKFNEVMKRIEKIPEIIDAVEIIRKYQQREQFLYFSMLSLVQKQNAHDPMGLLLKS
jgi:hypothetical protein